MEWQIGAQRSIEGRNLSVTCLTPLVNLLYYIFLDLNQFIVQIRWSDVMDSKNSGTYACHSEITCGSRFLKLIQTKYATATIYDFNFVINFPVFI